MSEKIRHYDCVKKICLVQPFSSSGLFPAASCFLLLLQSNQLLPVGDKNHSCPCKSPTENCAWCLATKKISWKPSWRKLFRTLLCGSLSSCWTLQSPISRWHPRRISEFSSFKNAFFLYLIFYDCNLQNVRKSWL